MPNSGEEVSGLVYEPSDAVEDMAAFDDLPLMLRRELTRAAFDIKAEPLLAAIQAGVGPIPLILEVRALCAQGIAQANEDRGVDLG